MKNILVVDSSLVVSYMLEQKLIKAGFNPYIANTVDTAYKYFEEDFVDF